MAPEAAAIRHAEALDLGVSTRTRLLAFIVSGAISITFMTP